MKCYITNKYISKLHHYTEWLKYGKIQHKTLHNVSIHMVGCRNREGVLCEMRIAEIWKGVFCRISSAECSANYTLDIFRIPQNSNKVK